MNFPRPIVFLVGALALLSGAACARKDWIDQTLVTVDVTGLWVGNVHSTTGPGGGGLELSLEQKGAKVVGSSRGSGGGSTYNVGTIEGTVRGDTLKFQDKRAAFTGELQVSGDDMTGPGTVPGWGAVVITFHRR